MPNDSTLNFMASMIPDQQESVAANNTSITALNSTILHEGDNDSHIGNVALVVWVSAVVILIFTRCIVALLFLRSPENRNNDTEKYEKLEERKRYIRKKLVIEQWKQDEETGRRDLDRSDARARTEDENGEAVTKALGSHAHLETIDSFVEEAGCAICLTNYEDGDKVCCSNNQNCGHVYHEHCMSTWLLKHAKCPLCRNPYLHCKTPDKEDDTKNGAVGTS